MVDKGQYRPVWDKPKSHIPREHSLDEVFSPIKADWRADAARSMGSQAALLLVLGHLISMLAIHLMGQPEWTLFNGPDRLFIALNFILAVAWLVMFLAMRRSWSIALPSACLAWSLADMTYAASFIAGHKSWWFVSAFAALASISGIRASLYRSRKMKTARSSAAQS
jgi:hypothetical protein